MSITPLATAKQHCRVIGNQQDQLLQSKLDTSEQSVAQYLQRNLYADAGKLADARAAASAALQTALDTIATARTAALALTDCDVRTATLAVLDDDKAAALQQFRWTMAGVVMDDTIESAVLLITGDLFENREATIAQAGVTVAIELPFGLKALLQPYRKGLGV